VDEDAGNITAPPTHGCMECKAQRPYTVERFNNGNTGWRCTVCGKILRLIPGKYTHTVGERGSDAETLIS
jgi:ribosomal protein L37AE/L43A